MELDKLDFADFNSRWPNLKEKIRSERPDITDEDLEYELGQEVALIKRLQNRTGKTEQEIFDWLHIMG